MLVAILTSVIGLANVRLISISLGNSTESESYFSTLIFFGFLTSMFSAVTVYLLDDFEGAKNFFLRKIIKHQKLFFGLYIILLAPLFAYDNKSSLLLILTLNVIVFEFIAAFLIINGNYLIQQFFRVIPYFFVFIFLIFFTESSIQLDKILVFGVSIGTMFFLLIYSKKNEFRTYTERTHSISSKPLSAIILLALVVVVKYIPVLESNYLISISALPLFIYSVKGYQFLSSVSEQVFGLNLYRNSKSWGEKEILIVLTLSAFIAVIVFFFKDILTSIVFKFTFIEQFDSITQIKLRKLSNTMFLILPISIFSIISKNIIVTNKGISIINRVIIVEIVGAFFFYKTNFFELGIFLPVLVTLFLWTCTSSIYTFYMPIKSKITRAIIFLLILSYALTIAKNIYFN